ncbi:hypothetical protein D3C76_93970 [compost metagenome]
MIKETMTWLFLAALLSAVTVTVLAASDSAMEDNRSTTSPPGTTNIKPGGSSNVPGALPGNENDATGHSTGVRPGDPSEGDPRNSGSGTSINRTNGSGTGGSGDAGGSSGSGSGTGAGSSAGGGTSGQ